MGFDAFSSGLKAHAQAGIADKTGANTLGGWVFVRPQGQHRADLAISVAAADRLAEILQYAATGADIKLYISVLYRITTRIRDQHREG